jgi:hypothetical protein
MKPPEEIREMQRQVRRGRTKQHLGDKGSDKIINRMDNRLVRARAKQRDQHSGADVSPRPSGGSPFEKTAVGAEKQKVQKPMQNKKQALVHKMRVKA